jgi:hypothetical protein
MKRVAKELLAISRLIESYPTKDAIALDKERKEALFNLDQAIGHLDEIFLLTENRNFGKFVSQLMQIAKRVTKEKIVLAGELE